MKRGTLYFLLEMVVCGPIVFGNVMNMEDPFIASNDVRQENFSAEESFEAKSKSLVYMKLKIEKWRKLWKTRDRKELPILNDQRFVDPT